MRPLIVPCLLVACLLAGQLAAPAFVFAEDQPTKAEPLASPSQAWQRINAESRKVPYAQRADKTKAAAEAYLARFADSGSMALANELLSLGLIQRAAQQWPAAAQTFQLAWANADHEATLRVQGAMQHAGLLVGKDAREALGAEAVGKHLTALDSFLQGLGDDDGTVSLRSNLASNLASAFDAVDDKAKARAMRIALVKRDPTMTGRMVRPLVNGLLTSCHDMAGYAQVQKEAEELLALLGTQQTQAIQQLEAKRDEAMASVKETSPDSIGEDGKLKSKPMARMSMVERVAFNAERQLTSAKRYADRIASAGKPFGMLGQPAPAWTLEHAFGDLKALGDLKGKVVVLDFWATWCPWCIRSFPAIRDLMRDYKDKGLVVVGVTASAGTVYAARYDLDDDLKDKAEPGKRATAAARLARGAQKPDGKTVFGPDEFPAKEKEVITTFIENHQMTWPVVMIDKTEPGPKYALGGWPHAVVIDRQGRIRYFKSGALLRDRPEAVAKFRKVLEDLLAEKAE